MLRLHKSVEYREPPGERRKCQRCLCRFLILHSQTIAFVFLSAPPLDLSKQAAANLIVRWCAEVGFSIFDICRNIVSNTSFRVCVSPGPKTLAVWDQSNTSFVTGKWEQQSGRRILFSAIMDPFSRLASWMAPQVIWLKWAQSPVFCWLRLAFTLTRVSEQSFDN